jgi:hypothetical protein
VESTSFPPDAKRNQRLSLLGNSLSAVVPSSEGPTVAKPQLKGRLPADAQRWKDEEDDETSSLALVVPLLKGVNRPRPSRANPRSTERIAGDASWMIR